MDARGLTQGRAVCGAVGALLLLLFAATAVSAQTGQITGRTTDASSGAPIGEVQVYLPGLSLGALSRQDGRFIILNVPAGTHELRAERIGLAPATQQVTVAAGGTAEVSFAMETQAMGLDEIVVTGAAGAARRREVGNAVVQIDVTDLPDRPVDAAAMLQSVAPGVELTLAGGELGNGSRIRLRGANSVEMDNDPIIYIDGVRMMGAVFPNNTSPEYRSARGSNNQPSALEQLNPNDIERIEVIKGSAATTLYGTEASGGVIQVFTKRGATGSPIWTAEIQQGTQWSRKFGANGVPYMWMEPWICTGPWQCGSHTHTAHSQQYSLSVRGGTQDVQYFVSAQHGREKGQLPESLEDWAVRGNFTVTPVPDLTLQWNTAFTNTWQKNIPVGGNAQGLPINVYRQLANYYNTTDPDVLSQLLDWDIQSTIRRLTTGGTITHNPLPNLSNRLTIGFDMSTQDSRNIRPFGFIGFPEGGADVDENGRYLLTFDYVGTFSFDLWSDLRSNFSWGGQAVGDESVHLEGFSTRFPGAANPTISSGSATLAFEERSKVWNAGFFFQNLFDFRDRYFLTVGVRVDGNSAFGSGFGLQVYPKASASWVLSDEAWFPESFGQLKLRTAYGQSGRAPGSFDAVRTWENVGIEGEAGFVPRNVGNANLGPEVTAEFEAGFDGSWMSDRLRVNLTYYRQMTDDALLEVDPTTSLGFTNSQLMNVGRIRNSGLELGLDATLVQTERFGLDAGVNYSSNHSKVLSHVLPERVGKPVEYHEAFVVLNPDEIGAPDFELLPTYIGPSLPTQIINGSLALRLPGSVLLAARGEFKGGYYGQVEPVDIPRSPRSPACLPFYASSEPDGGVALRDGVSALWRARCTPGINRGWNFKQDNFRLTSVSATVPLTFMTFAPGPVQNATFMASLNNAYTWFSEIPLYDTSELDNYRLPSPVSLRFSIRTTF